MERIDKAMRSDFPGMLIARATDRTQGDVCQDFWTSAYQAIGD